MKPERLENERLVRRPEVTTPLIAARQGKVARQHADYRMGLAVELNIASENSGVGGKTRAPQGIGEDYRSESGLFLGKKVPAHRRMYAQRRKEVG